MLQPCLVNLHWTSWAIAYLGHHLKASSQYENAACQQQQEHYVHTIGIIPNDIGVSRAWLASAAMHTSLHKLQFIQTVAAVPGCKG